mmetsp:Transcript_18064/g.45242  ORF Transcript_18064/g.45242 Transcript_18064/m.45242 type:complete len:277 (-) Transcript_18064:4932-5762(-)
MRWGLQELMIFFAHRACGGCSGWGAATGGRRLRPPTPRGGTGTRGTTPTAPALAVLASRGGLRRSPPSWRRSKNSRCCFGLREVRACEEVDAAAGRCADGCGGITGGFLCMLGAAASGGRRCAARTAADRPCTVLQTLLADDTEEFVKDVAAAAAPPSSASILDVCADSVWKLRIFSVISCARSSIDCIVPSGAIIFARDPPIAGPRALEARRFSDVVLSRLPVTFETPVVVVAAPAVDPTAPRLRRAARSLLGPVLVASVLVLGANAAVLVVLLD